MTDKDARPDKADYELGQLPEPDGPQNMMSSMLFGEHDSYSADAMREYALTEVKRAVAAERERWAHLVKTMHGTSDHPGWVAAEEAARKLSIMAAEALHRHDR